MKNSTIARASRQRAPAKLPSDRSGEQQQQPTPADSAGAGLQDTTASRLATLRAIASGLSHDLCNALMPIRLAVESLAGADLSPRARADLESIRCSSEYLRNLCNGLRMLSRDPKSPGCDGGSTELSPWWQEFEPLVRSMLKGRVAVAEFASDSPMLVGLPRHRLTHAVFAVLQRLAEAQNCNAPKVELWIEPGDDLGSVRICAAARQSEGKDFTEQRSEDAAAGHFDLGWVQEIVGEAGGKIEVEARPGWETVYALRLPPADSASESTARREPCRSAVLNLPLGRQRAYVRSVLEAHHVHLLEASQAPSDGLGLWITADADEAMAVAQQSELRATLRVLFFGHAIPGAPSNMIFVGPRLDAAAVREVLKNALRTEPAIGAVAR